jgi:(p)ppGpp synthase/HD superfamily hydrolase
MTTPGMSFNGYPEHPIGAARLWGGPGDALAVATIAHQGQKYGDRPYIEHPIAVARLITNAFGLYEHLTIPALLHDVVEDSAIQIHEITNLFGRDVADTVDSVTRRTLPGGTPEPYTELINRAAAHPQGLIVKLADNTHNLSTLPRGDRRERRYLNARAVLLTAYRDDDPWADIITARVGAQ